MFLLDLFLKSLLSTTEKGTAITMPQNEDEVVLKPQYFELIYV